MLPCAVLSISSESFPVWLGQLKLILLWPIRKWFGFSPRSWCRGPCPIVVHSNALVETQVTQALSLHHYNDVREVWFNLATPPPGLCCTSSGDHSVTLLLQTWLAACFRPFPAPFSTVTHLCLRSRAVSSLQAPQPRSGDGTRDRPVAGPAGGGRSPPSSRCSRSRR